MKGLTLEGRLRAFIASEAARLASDTVRLELAHVLNAMQLRDTPENRDRIKRALANIARTNH